MYEQVHPFISTADPSFQLDNSLYNILVKTFISSPFPILVSKFS